MRTSAGAPLLGRSTDGGAHFTINDLGADLGTGLLRIIAIDPAGSEPRADAVPRRRRSVDRADRRRRDDRRPSRSRSTATSTRSSRLPSGTILVGGVVDYSTTPGLFRSHDRGDDLRDGAESARDPRAVAAGRQGLRAPPTTSATATRSGTSTDEGTTWQAFMTYADVKAINPCLKTHCQTTCEAEVGVSRVDRGRVLGGRARTGAAGSSGAGGAGRRRSRGRRGRRHGRRRRNAAAQEARRLRRCGRGPRRCRCVRAAGALARARPAAASGPRLIATGATPTSGRG